MVPLLLLSKNDNLPVMLKVKANFNLSNAVVDTFRSGAEDSLTAQGFMLISKEQQDEALKQQAEQQNSDCYDDACLVDTGKMMAAQMIFIINVSKMGKEYIFKARLVDLESGSTKKTVTKVYKGRLSSATDLLKFSKELTNEALGVQKEEIIKIDDKFKDKILVDNFVKVIFKTKPSNAKVFVDKQFVGYTPLQIKLKKGLHSYKITKKYYNDYEVEKKFFYDKEEEIELALKWYKLIIIPKPADSFVYFAGRIIGRGTSVININLNDIKLNRKLIIKRNGYYKEIIKLNKYNLINSKKIYIELKEIKKHLITIVLKQRGIYVIKYKGNCQIQKINNQKYQITDYEYNTCKIKLSRMYFYDKIITVKFNNNDTIYPKLREFKKYKLKINIYPEDTQIILNDNYGNKYHLHSGIPELLYKGKYYCKFTRKGYIMRSNKRSFIDLDKDKAVNYNMIRSTLQFFKIYSAFNLNMGKDLLYSSSILGADIINLIKIHRVITIGLSYNNNLTDNYGYMDFYSDFKFGENFYYGITSSLLLGKNVKTFMLGVLLEYEYKIKNDFFVKGRFTTGYSSFSEVSDYFFYAIGGIYFGWNGF